MFLLYSILLTVAFVVMSPLFLLRREKYAAGLRERFGILPEFRHDNRSVLWIHCVSVGEANAARPLVEEIKKQFPNYRIVVSTTTKTGQNLAREIFKNKAEVVFYFPFDWAFTVRRALDRFKPSIVLLMETELWFNFIREASKSGAVVAVVNGRLSEKSFKNYSLIKKFMRRVLRRVDLALMQGQADADRILQLGVHRSKVKVTGNIKFDQKFEQSELTEILWRRFRFSGDSPLIIAASTHAPEEKWILEAFKKVHDDSPQQFPRLMLVPRHPERFYEVAELIDNTNFNWVRRSSEETFGDKLADVILLDSIGELRAALPLAEIVFVGGSLIPHGGQSILEPAVVGKPVITGFYTMNFAAVVKEFLAKNAIVQLPEMSGEETVEKLAQAFTELLKNAEKREILGANALAVMQENRGATLKTIENLRPFLQVHNTQ
jgi:3-deoxy-D-manno-octulosonic-acid transferase